MRVIPSLRRGPLGAFARGMERRVLTAVSARPALYFGLRRLTGSLDRLCVTRKTDIVIEGFPRSANSTTVTVFRSWQRKKVRIAHHKHHAAQILRAVAWDIPAVALIREPRAAVISLIAMLEETRRRQAKGEADPAFAAQTGGVLTGCALTGGTAGQALLGRAGDPDPDFTAAFRWWIGFYAPLLACRDRIVIAPFEQATGNLTAVIRAVNRRFGSDFRAKPRKVQIERQKHGKTRRFGWRSMPDPLREAVKAEVEAAFARALDRDRRLRSLVAEAETLYSRFVDA